VPGKKKHRLERSLQANRTDTQWVYPSGMNVLRMLAELRQERAQIEEAIMAI
jgi:hypothetical protein